MDDKDFYAPWEWQPMERIPDGCQDVDVKDVTGEVHSICSCDYWWWSADRKATCESFRMTYC